MKIIPSRVVSEQFHSLLLLLLFHDRVGRALPPSLPPRLITRYSCFRNSRALRPNNFPTVGGCVEGYWGWWIGRGN